MWKTLAGAWKTGKAAAIRVLVKLLASFFTAVFLKHNSSKTSRDTTKTRRKRSCIPSALYPPVL
jgi:hypothetical protein